jgi:hypothetical protein
LDARLQITQSSRACQSERVQPARSQSDKGFPQYMSRGVAYGTPKSSLMGTLHQPINDLLDFAEEDKLVFARGKHAEWVTL